MRQGFGAADRVRLALAAALSKMSAWACGIALLVVPFSYRRTKFLARAGWAGCAVDRVDGDRPWFKRSAHVFGDALGVTHLAMPWARGAAAQRALSQVPAH
jgi:hypothetical protein